MPDPVRWHRARVLPGPVFGALGLASLATGVVVNLTRPGLAGAATEPEFVVGYLALLALGVVLAVRVPDNPVSWWLLAWAVGASTWFGATQLASVAAASTPRPWWTPGVAWLSAWAWGSSLLIPLVLLRFPTGRLPSPAWRWPWRAGVASVVLVMGTAAVSPGPVQDDMPLDNPLGLAVPGLEGVFLVALNVVTLTMAVAVVSLVVRYRRADPVERLQLRWVLSASVVMAFGAALSVVSQVVAVPDAVEHVVTAAGMVLLAAAIARAVTRHRLYDLDRLVGRTVSYGLVTVAVIAVYVVVVLATQTLLDLDEPPDVVVAASTLVAAAVFRPALRWTRGAVDRRFHRAHHDAVATVDAFGARLRDEVDLDAIQRDIVEVVGATLAPAGASLWLLGPAAPASGLRLSS